MLVLLFSGSSKKPAHEFYVSIFEIDFNPETHNLEITGKIFSDDLEDAVNAHLGSNIKVSPELNSENISPKVGQYLQDKIDVIVDGLPAALNWVGLEVEMDVTWCYLEVELAEKPAEIEFNNRVLFELYPGQMNIMHFNGNPKVETELLRKGDNVAVFRFLG